MVMVQAKSKKCGQQGYTKGPSYGVHGSNGSDFCAEHKKEGMVRIFNSRRNSQCGPRSKSGVKWRGRFSFLTTQTETSPRSSSGGASKRAWAVGAAPLALLGAQHRSGTPTLGRSSSSVATVKEEVVPTSAEAREVRGGRGWPHAMPLSLLGVRSFVQGGRHGASPLTRFEPVQASEASQDSSKQSLDTCLRKRLGYAASDRPLWALGPCLVLSFVVPSCVSRPGVFLDLDVNTNKFTIFSNGVVCTQESRFSRETG